MPASNPRTLLRRRRADQRAAGRLGLLLLAGAASLVLAWFSGQAARRQAGEELTGQAATTATLNAAVLRSELEKQRSLPFVLAQDPDLLAALAQPDGATFATLNRKLETLSQGTGANVIYLIDATGLAVAASNWQEPTSFVGNDYRFREYFQRGMQAGAAEHFALGTVSRQPGLYISRRLGPAAAPLGVVVVKVEFDAVEETWRVSDRAPGGEAARPVYVTDEQGIVLLTSRPAWRFRTDRPLPVSALADIRESLQFGDAPLTELPLRPNPAAPDTGAVLLDDADGRATPLLRVSQAVPTAPWRLTLLVPAEATLMAAERQRRWAVLLGCLLAIGLGAVLLQRRDRALRRAASQEAARQELEERVAARTAQLRGEIAERERMETRLEDARETLRQANRLATLGQVVAGVAHEINQPVAAIRSYAGNTATFLDRGELAPARRNLETITKLTERIGGITDELRTFSRKGVGPVRPVRVAEAVDGAVMLLRSRLDHQGVPLFRPPMPGDPRVLGRQVRLEQVLVNLIQNALEALEGRPDPEIHLEATIQEGEVRIVLRDNGPGIPPEIQKALFMPFSTSKAQGLGLGLVLCNDIVTEAGGRIEVASTPERGTAFTIILPEYRGEPA
ncbi:sensor histidine kinase [Roseomonas aerophila]|uniref:histidine kinase n=1 Tax=Teichococcus aerophilus TaxID=1224513 RepID=A0ABR7RLV7_9PROT|nr:ATP-binding protein [Pseudoroseomonas aerophila]MBC9207574.1 sensor histidine kinase [Pseudoroseomonas aerophila]